MELDPLLNTRDALDLKALSNQIQHADLNEACLLANAATEVPPVIEASLAKEAARQAHASAVVQSPTQQTPE